MFARLLLCTTLCLGPADAQFGELALFEVAFEVADEMTVTVDLTPSSKDPVSSQVLQKLDDIKNELDEVRGDITDIQQTLTMISDEVQHLGEEVIHQMHLLELDRPYARIQYFDVRVQNTEQGRDDLANDILSGDGVGPARELLLDTLQGTCPSCEGQTILQRQLTYSGAVPVHFAQSMIRLLTTSQYLMSWAYERLGRLDDRQHDYQHYNQKYEDMWKKNTQTAFYMMGGCQWDKRMALTCSSTTHRATKTFRFQNGTEVPAENLSVSGNTISLPTKGSNHPEWSFDVSCANHGYAVGMNGGCNVPDGHAVHYVAGFHLHCSDGYDTGETYHHKTNAQAVPFDFKLHKPMKKMSGCVNTPEGHVITYWASDCTISSADDEDKHVIEPVSPDGCGWDNSIQYQLDCGDGLVMQGFTGQSEVPNDHYVSYIAKMDITCVPYIDQQRSMPHHTMVLV